MSMNDIIRMAREAGFTEYEIDDGTLGAFDVRYERFFHAAYAAGASAEREAMVAIVNDNVWGGGVCFTDDLLAAIRARSKE